jgi:cobalt-precorrin 5A hydrolase/precorrin-3B C17-methyltransferase
LAATGDSGILRVPKVKSNGSSGVGRATCAIAKASECLNPETIGRPQGTLFIVGTGPGSPQWRLPESEKMLRKATDWVGYGLYLDLISDLHNGQELHPFNLGQEEIRVRHALKLAAQGKTVALVSSGDPGIYAMSTLVFELLERGEQEGSDPLEWQRVRVETAPGISALQAANARIGAPMGHDFCTISLSDLLTPWETIERRIKTAAEGDFVIAFYNPVSRRRTTQLAQAREILLQHRPSGTSVILARNLGRVEEKVQVITLENLDPTQVDMLTVVLVGSSQTRRLQLLNGEVKVYTPRGYANKQ